MASTRPARTRTSATVWARRATQAAFLLLFLFLFLQTEQKGADSLGYPVKWFLDVDPLLFLGTWAASHQWVGAFAWSIGLLVLTALLGRVFCGWVCPLGTLNNMVGALKKWPARPRARGWFHVKYLLLVGLLAASLLGLQWVGVFDPLSLTVRSLALGVYPALNAALNAGLDLLYAPDVPAVRTVAVAVSGLLKRTILAFQQPHFTQAAVVGLLFAAVLALNWVERRFWCRYLCPLGALLGVVGRWSLLKRNVSEGCTSCGLCDHGCQGGASTGDGEGWRPSECLACFNCGDACPTGSAGFGFTARPAPEGVDLSRRRILAAAAAGAVAVPLLRIAPSPRTGRPNPLLIRPPGAAAEPEFLERCVKCGECMKVCTTGGLQPALTEAGLEGLWTPVLVPRIGYCEYNCTLCGQVCPTQAIARLPRDEKVKVKIGLATVDKSRCLPFAHAVPCIVCEEVCPTPTKAIWFEEVTVRNRAGEPVDVKQPHVDLDLCIGCGICEAKCPVLDRPAIAVTSIGETRSPDNRLLLEGSYPG